MILYFSATGNSAYVAKQIGAQIEDETLNLLKKFQTQDYSPLYSDKPWVVVVPVYAWQIPPIVSDWLRKTPLEGNKDVYFIITCGGSIGNAGKYVKDICDQKQLNYMGSTKIVMPDNYITLFKAPTVEEAMNIVDAAAPSIKAAADIIRSNMPLPEARIRLVDKIMSGPINKGFNAYTNSAKNFHADASCTGCGRCVSLCPNNNVSLIAGSPAWGNACINCMACICLCPKNAIEHKKNGKKRYECPKR